jgi:hypothetical protein
MVTTESGCNITTEGSAVSGVLGMPIVYTWLIMLPALPAASLAKYFRVVVEAIVRGEL